MIKHTHTHEWWAGNDGTTSVLLARYLGTSMTTTPPSPSAYQPPTGQVLTCMRRGPQPATSPLSQLSLDFSEHKPLLSENLKRRSDKAEDLPETDPCVYLAAAWQSPIPTVEAVRGSHAHRAPPPPPPWFDHVEWESHGALSAFGSLYSFR